MKNQYVNKVKYAKSIFKKSTKTFTRTVDVYDDKTKKKIGTKDVEMKFKVNTINTQNFNKQLDEAYNDYKNKLKEYNKGEIGLEQVEIADYKLFNVLENIKNVYNKKSLKGTKSNYFDEEATEFLERVTGRGGKGREEVLKNTKYEGYNIYNAVAEILNKAEGKEVYTGNDIYNKLYSNALETQRYEELVEELAEGKAKFNSILADLKRDNKLTKADEDLITAILVI